MVTPNNISLDHIRNKVMYRMAVQIMTTFCVVFGALTIYFVRSETSAVYFYFAIFLVAIAGLLITVLTKKFKTLFWLCTISGTVIIQVSCNTVMDTIHFVDFLWASCICLLAFWGLGRKVGFAFVIINAAGISYFIFSNLNTQIITLEPQSMGQKISVLIEILLAFFVFSYLLYQFVTFQILSNRELMKVNSNLKKNNQLIVSKNDENITLVKEIHHRVKNNLQIIISLLRLQRSEIKNEEAQKQFTEAIHRVLVMSSIHERLYGEKEFTHVQLKTYLQNFSSEVKEVFTPYQDIQIHLEVELDRMDLKNIVPFGLLFNELLSNSLKYAFDATHENKQISIYISALQEGQYKFNYSDNGNWKGSGGQGFGLDLIAILTDQLNGTYNFYNSDKGSFYQFELELLHPDPEIKPK